MGRIIRCFKAVKCLLIIENKQKNWVFEAINLLWRRILLNQVICQFDSTKQKKTIQKLSRTNTNNKKTQNPSWTCAVQWVLQLLSKESLVFERNSIEKQASAASP